MKKFKKGFTLVELVIVIAVIAILAAVLIPTFTGILTRTKKNANLQEVSSAFHEAYSTDEQILPADWIGRMFVKDGSVYIVEDGLVVRELSENEVSVSYENNKMVITNLSNNSVTKYMLTENLQMSAYDIAMYVAIPSGISYVNGGIVTNITSGFSYLDGEEMKYVDFDHLESGKSLEDYITISTDGDVKTLSAINATYKNKIVEFAVPAEVNVIGASLFSGNLSLTTVLFADNPQITTIGNQAFYNCRNLSVIDFPEGLVTIGNQAFKNSSQYSFCDQATNIHGNLNSYTNLVSITIPSTLVSIGDEAFYYNFALSTIVFAEDSHLTTIGAWAFYQCLGLVYLHLPASVTTLGANAFRECDCLVEVTCENPDIDVTDSSKFIYNFEKANKPGSEVIIHDNGLVTYSYTEDNVEHVYLLKYIPTNGVRIITAEMIESTGATEVYDSAFACSQIDEIYFPETITRVGITTFVFSSVSKIVYSRSIKNISIQMLTCSYVDEFIIPDGSQIEEIDEEFNWYSGMTWGWGPGLHTVLNIPYANLVTLGSESLTWCNLPDVVNLTNIVTIGARAFAYSEHVNGEAEKVTINIGKNCTSIANNAFSASIIGSINVDAENEVYCSVDGALYLRDGMTLVFDPNA